MRSLIVGIIDSGVSCQSSKFTSKKPFTKFHSIKLVAGFHDQEKKNLFIQVKHIIFDESESCLKELHILLKTPARMQPKFKSSEQC